MYMIDSNGAKDASDPSVKKEKGIYPDTSMSVTGFEEVLREANPTVFSWDTATR